MEEAPKRRELRSGEVKRTEITREKMDESREDEKISQLVERYLK